MDRPSAATTVEGDVRNTASRAKADDWGTCDPERLSGENRGSVRAIAKERVRGETHSAFWEDDIGREREELV